MALVARDIGAFIKGELALTPAVITAGAGNDGVEVNGPGVDRLGGRHYLSAKLIIAWDAVLASAQTLSITANLQDDTALAFDGTPADYGDAFPLAVVADQAVDGGSPSGTTELRFDLSSARKFVRAQVTATLSAGATDTVAIAAVLVLGGADEEPV